MLTKHSNVHKWNHHRSLHTSIYHTVGFQSGLDWSSSQQCRLSAYMLALLTSLEQAISLYGSLLSARSVL